MSNGEGESTGVSERVGDGERNMFAPVLEGHLKGG